MSLNEEMRIHIADPYLVWDSSVIVVVIDTVCQALLPIFRRRKESARRFDSNWTTNKIKLLERIDLH